MRTISKEDLEKVSGGLEKVANDTLNKWIGVVTNIDNEGVFKNHVAASLFAELASYAGELSRDLIDDQIRAKVPALIDKAVHEWLDSGKIDLSQARISSAVRRVITEVVGDEHLITLSVSKKRRVIYKLVNDGMARRDVAEQMKMSIDTVNMLYRSAKKQHKDLLTSLKHFQ